MCRGKPKPEYAGKDKKTFFEANLVRADHIEKVQWYCSHVGDRNVSVREKSLRNKIKEVLGKTTSKTIYELQNCVMKNMKQNYT